MKMCSYCGTKKSAESFWRSKDGKDGLQNWCKQCALAYERAIDRHEPPPPKTCHHPEAWRFPNAPPHLLTRFLPRITFGDGCWNWDVPNALTGYGYFHFGGDNKNGGKSYLVHRLAYEWSRGPIPPKLQIDHLCRNRLCANPAHMEAVTLQENIRRGGCISAVNARKTHCPKGHPYTRRNARGNRICAACMKESTLKCKESKKA